ncbi:MAG: succinate dehydrogenase/fumarate reductase iron-sulfur subunit, partial [Bacteroidales bacterium]|nr:succinate dehydrogenase/fumarate reductase iron-sulfur subunit [Bacteroidales bacterium]
MDFTLKIWRQKNARSKGKFVTYPISNVSSDSSFLEMLDQLNESLVSEDQEPVAFDHDCREGICGCCGTVVNGRTHGSYERTTLCQLHMRKFKNNDTIIIEPFKAKPFKVIKDLIIDRSVFDKILSAGGYISVKTGSATEANSILISPEKAELAMDAAACIGCGACVAACPN